MIWSDCQAVVRRFRRIFLGAPVRISSPNADLWMLIADDVLGGCNVQITKAAAHQPVSSASSPIEEWGFMRNQFADRVAAHANERRSSAFWDLLARHASACRVVDEWNAMMSGMPWYSPSSCRSVVRFSYMLAEQRRLNRSRVNPCRCQFGKVCHKLRFALLEQSGGMETQLLPKWPNGFGLQWLRKGDLLSGFPMPSCMLIMRCRRGMLGPFMWGDGRTALMFRCMRSNTLALKREHDGLACGKVLREILRHAGISVQSRYWRPASHMVCMFASCLAMPWCAQRLDAVDRWLQRFSVGPLRRQSREVDRLPIPVTNASRAP